MQLLTTDTFAMTIGYGDVLLIHKSPVKVRKPTNPYTFDYSKYLANNHIHAQAFVAAHEVSIIKRYEGRGVQQLLSKAKERLNQRIEAYLPDPQVQQIAKALLIGAKDDLDQEVKAAYSNAGAMHILAVSGFHVGIIYLMLSWVLKPLHSLKHGKVVFVFLSITAIWGYAFLMGMSPSVFRAAIMFSFLSLAQIINRKKNILNILGLAAFVILVIDPMFLFKVGFQLSFLAVFGIVYLFPKFNVLVEGRNKFVQWAWSATCVSLCAQIATLPLVLYYFHQFPSYALLSNLAVITAAFVILWVGVPFLLLGGFPFIGKSLSFILHWTIKFLNEVIFQVQSLPGSTIDWIQISAAQATIIYCAIICLCLALQNRNFILLSMVFLFVLTFFVLDFNYKYKSINNKNIILYNFGDQLVIDLIMGKNSLLLANGQLKENDLRYTIQPFRRTKHLNKPIPSELKKYTSHNGPLRFLEFDHKKIVFLDGDLEEYDMKRPIHCDVLIVSNNSLSESDFDKFTVDHCIVLDRTNKFWYAREIIQKAQPGCTHHLAKDGYWSLYPI